MPKIVATNFIYIELLKVANFNDEIVDVKWLFGELTTFKVKAKPLVYLDVLAARSMNKLFKLSRLV